MPEESGGRGTGGQGWWWAIFRQHLFSGTRPWICWWGARIRIVHAQVDEVDEDTDLSAREVPSSTPNSEPSDESFEEGDVMVPDDDDMVSAVSFMRFPYCCSSYLLHTSFSLVVKRASFLAWHLVRLCSDARKRHAFGRSHIWLCAQWYVFSL